MAFAAGDGTADVLNHQPRHRTGAATSPKPIDCRQRACDECKRKKTKCDMLRPKCSLCSRTDKICVFPETSRKSPRSATARKKARRETKGQQLDRLLALLESGMEKHQFDGAPPLFDFSALPPDMMPTLPDVDGIASPNAPNFSLENDMQSTSAREDDQPDFLGVAHNSAFWDSLPSPDSHLTPPDKHLDPTNLTSNTTSGDLSDLNLILDMGDAAPSASSMDGSPSTALFADTQEYFSEAPHDDLLQLYFDKVQPFLPLFHQPRFETQFKGKISHIDLSTAAACRETAFVLNAMFALSARFSSSDFFADRGRTTRGEPFAQQAARLLEQLNSSPTAQSSLRMLQGTILLACYRLSSGITSRAWVLTGLCSRMAYELGLHELDRDTINGQPSVPETAETWVDDEEKRRAWWSAWELDHFASTISCRPYGFDRRRADILLPIADKDWFAGLFVASAPLVPDALDAWQSLADCPNQCERAWYLVGLNLVRLGHELRGLDVPAVQKGLRDLESAVKYFALALPPSFDVSSGVTCSGSDAGWIISTHVMVHSTLLSISRRGLALGEHNPFANTSDPNMMERLRNNGRAHTGEILSAIRAWAPKLMPFSPFLACAIIGPGAIHVENCLTEVSEGRGHDDRTAERDLELLKLCLKRHAWYWELGELLLDVVQICSKRRTSGMAALSSTEKEKLKRIPLLAPGLLLPAR